MHDIKKQMQFIELRAQRNSYQTISKKIGVSKQTLVKWSKLASTQARVAELEALEFDAIKEAHGLLGDLTRNVLPLLSKHRDEWRSPTPAGADLLMKRSWVSFLPEPYRR